MPGLCLADQTGLDSGLSRDQTVLLTAPNNVCEAMDQALIITIIHYFPFFGLLSFWEVSETGAAGLLCWRGHAHMTCTTNSRSARRRPHVSLFSFISFGLTCTEVLFHFEQLGGWLAFLSSLALNHSWPAFICLHSIIPSWLPLSCPFSSGSLTGLAHRLHMRAWLAGWMPCLLS